MIGERKGERKREKSERDMRDRETERKRERYPRDGARERGT